MVFARRSKTCFKKLLFVVIGGAVLFMLYWGVLQPLYLIFFPKQDVYHNLSYYESESYLAFEGGRAFREGLLKCGYSENGELVDFYYYDNHHHNNIFYGKASNIFILEVKMQEDDYKNAKESQQDTASTEITLGDFLLCATPYKESDISNVMVVGFCDAKHVIRYIMITGEGSTHSVIRLITLGSDCDWNANSLKTD